MAVVSRNWKLPEELIALSVEKRWPDVLHEWGLDYVEVLEPEEDAETCLCHHHPIREVCHITNSRNGNTSIVGNCCITKFKDDEPIFAGTHKIFDAFKRIKSDIDASVNEELIDYAFSKGVLDERGYKFYLEIWRKRSLSVSQQRWKQVLNQRIITNLTAARHHDVVVVAEVHNVGDRALQQSIEYLRSHPTTLAARLLVTDALDRGFIAVRDCEFYNSLFERHVSNPSIRQQQWINDINHKILLKY